MKILKPSKKIIHVFIVVLVTCVLIFISTIVKKIGAKKITQSKIQELPQVKLYSIDSSLYVAPSSSLAIIFFNSDCEYCQYEIYEVSKKQELFLNKEVIFVSSENISVIQKISEKFNLTHSSNIHFVKINAEDVFNTFGSLYIPHIFIYGKDRKLIKEFKGETKIEAILKYLP